MTGGILHSPHLLKLPWIEHGFGTRAAPLNQQGMAALNQIHSAIVLEADRNEGRVGDGDALFTREPGRTLSVRTADCLPILLASPRGVAVVHAGWRGTTGQIVRKTVLTLQEKIGIEPSELHASIGPGIGACCYEVGKEVARQFGLNGPAKIDLAAENRRQLVDSGVLSGNVSVLEECTRCNQTQFYSYRREGDAAGRMISFIRLLA